MICPLLPPSWQVTARFGGVQIAQQREQPGKQLLEPLLDLQRQPCNPRSLQACQLGALGGGRGPYCKEEV